MCAFLRGGLKSCRSVQSMPRQFGGERFPHKQLEAADAAIRSGGLSGGWDEGKTNITHRKHVSIQIGSARWVNLMADTLLASTCIHAFTCCWVELANRGRPMPILHRAVEPQPSIVKSLFRIGLAINACEVALEHDFYRASLCGQFQDVELMAIAVLEAGWFIHLTQVDT